jgi:hypothetical protein
VQYYILVGSEQRGPFSWEELRGQPLQPDTLVWHDSLPDWKPALHVSELASLLGPYASPASPAANGPPDALPAAFPAYRKHSRFGITAFVLAIVAGVSLLGMIVAAGVMAASNPNAGDEPAPVMIALGLGIFAAIGAHVIGLGLALAGLFERDRYRTFPILGLCFNFLALLSIGGLMLIGFYAK